MQCARAYRLYINIYYNYLLFNQNVSLSHSLSFLDLNIFYFTPDKLRVPQTFGRQCIIKPELRRGCLCVAVGRVEGPGGHWTRRVLGCGKESDSVSVEGSKLACVHRGGPGLGGGAQVVHRHQAPEPHFARHPARGHRTCALYNSSFKRSPKWDGATICQKLSWCDSGI